jgi:3-oxoadipate enol-lactonase
VVTCDLRGHGASPASADFTIEEMAGDVAAMLDTLEAGRVAVAGLSLGGSVAQAFACRYPQRTASLALIDTTAWYGPAAVREWAARAERARSSGLRSLSQFQLDRWFSDDFRMSSPDLCADLLECFARTDLTSYEATCHALGALDVRAALPDVKAPTLVLVGSEDPATPPSHARDLCERIPNAALRVLQGARHLTPVERPREVAGLLNGFFRSNES